VPRRWALTLGAFFLALVLGLGVRGFWRAVSGGGDDLGSSVSLTPRNLSGAVGGEGTDEYNKMIDELNRAGAREALAKGKSYVPTPVGARTAAAEARRPGPKPGPPPPELPPRPMAPPVGAPPGPNRSPGPAPAPPNSGRSDETLSRTGAGAAAQTLPDDAALLNDLRGLAQRRGQAGQFVARATPGGPAAVSGTDDGGPVPAAPPEGLEPGRVHFAVTELAADSDVPGPVTARVVSGPLKGARFLGGFERRGERLEMRFQKLAAPWFSEPVGVEALAVDPSTGSPAVRGRVDSHFLERWGGLLASAFLEGFGDAMSDRGTTVTVSGDVLVNGRSGDPSWGELSLEALGTVGRRASGQLEKGFDRPPTVTLPAGSQLGVLITGVR
jgi:hypothetical protein